MFLPSSHFLISMAFLIPMFVFFVTFRSDDPRLVSVHNVIISSAVADFKLWHICQADPTCKTAEEDTSATAEEDCSSQSKHVEVKTTSPTLWPVKRKPFHHETWYSSNSFQEIKFKDVKVFKKGFYKVSFTQNVCFGCRWRHEVGSVSQPQKKRDNFMKLSDDRVILNLLRSDDCPSQYHEEIALFKSWWTATTLS